MPILRKHSADAYGSSAGALIQPIQASLATLAEELVATFHASVPPDSREAELFVRLRPHELDGIKSQQVNYLAMLLSADLTREAHLEAARRTGRVHVFVGVESGWLVDVYAFYQDEILRLLREKVPDPQPRETLMRVFAKRFQLDVEMQTSCHHEVAGEVAEAISRLNREMMSRGNLTDLIRTALETIGGLPSGVSVFFARVDKTGVLQIEQSHGEAAGQYHRMMEDGVVPKISIDSSRASGKGPGGRAWRSGEIIVSDAWLIESDKAPWLEAGKTLGFRASAAVPILDESGHSIAMLSMYNAWPGYFSTRVIRAFLNHAQQVISFGVQQRINAPVVPLGEQNAYRALLSEQRLVMHYQPIIDLRDGSLIKIEGLSRLRDRDGKLIPPRLFLPILGRDELLQLFKFGIDQACRDINTLHVQGIHTSVAVNLPAKGLDDSRYEKCFFDALEKYGLTPDRFQLEILETQDSSEITVHRRNFIRRLQAAGVRISQDDLGSGHSSLLRLDTYPFDEVKIDQGLVRSSRNNPKRTLDFILYLTRLAHAFNRPVTIEGLENDGIMEAAAILGADYGQGFGIAHPMPVDELPAWQHAFNYTVNPSKPRTGIGALAGYLLWDLQLATISEQPELAAEFASIETMVEQFIHANQLEKSPIEQLLIRYRQLVAIRDLRSDTASKTRNALIQALTDHWKQHSGS